MFRQLTFLCAAVLAVAACAGSEGGAAAAEPALPRGASVGPAGYATILDAPPAPFTPVKPGTPAPPSAEQVAAQEQFTRVSRFQARVRPEVHALANHLRDVERGNFVDLYFENEGEPSVVFQFLRNGPATLRKYSSNPAFVAETVRFSKAELQAAMDFMIETFRENRVIQGGGTGSNRNRAVVEIAVTEAEFRDLVARKDVDIPDAVELEFAAERPASEINRPLPPRIAPLIRIFPRDNRPTGMLLAIDSRAKVVLQDGCFRVKGGDQDGALVLFPLGARLFVDSEGYLAFGASETRGYARVGETIVTPGSIGEVTTPELVEPIHAACGTGKVVKIHGMRSATAERAQDVVTSNANALREFREAYGLIEAQARKALEECKKSFGGGTCITSPPPPVLRAQDCPAGTTLSGGLCRTPEGYIRPLPKWLRELVAG